MSRLRLYLEKYQGKDLILVGPLLENHTPAQWQDPIVFVDGGSRFRPGKLGFTVGDGDSSEASLDEKLPAEKDLTDLGYALLQVGSSFRRVHALGFWGGRKDHEFANLGEFHNFLTKQSAATEVLLPPHAKAFSRGNWKLELTGLFSLLVLEKSKIRITGDVKYPVSQARDFDVLSGLGISNEASGTIHIESDLPFFLFYPQ